MERDIYKKLLEWKRSSRRKPLIINGARQVGKTYALKRFGERHYQKTVYLNFEKDELLCKYFEESLDPKAIIKILAIHTGIEIETNNTLIIFDEIQECPKALNSLKYFCEEASEFHVASAGSLLGVKIAKGKGFPVGKVNFLPMFPLTFFEFLSAIGEEKLRLFLEEAPLNAPIPFHEKLIGFLKFYLFVGGMPEAVFEYARSENVETVRTIQQEILSAYERDFSKHAPHSEVMKISSVWKQVPKQLAKENKKFIFASIRKSARGREYEESIQWLLDAGLIHKSYLVETPKIPISAYANHHSFKIFSLDVGLLGAQSNLRAQTIIDGDVLFSEFKGSLTENFVIQELIATQERAPYYWTSEHMAEIDYLFEGDGSIFPLEIKAEASLKKKSLLIYDERYGPSRLFRTSTMNLKLDGKIHNFPLYLISKLGIGLAGFVEAVFKGERDEVD